jgi:hypothetical protein
MGSLALVPLPRAAIGSAARLLPVEPGAGAVSNASFNSDGFETASSLARAGRVIGYYLDYGDDLTSSAPVSRVDSSVSEWRSAKDARREVNREVRQGLTQTEYSRFGLPTRAEEETDGHAVGGEDVSLILSYRFSQSRIVHCDLERASDGRYLLIVQACGASRTAVQRLVPILIRRLDQRLHLALAGRLHGKPVRSPSLPKAGPPAHGPKPAALALRADDLPAKNRQGGYEESSARSLYDLSLSRAGQFAHVNQEIALTDNSLFPMWWAADYLYAATHSGSYAGATGRVLPRSIRLAGVPDHALGQVVRVPLPNGRVSYHGHIALRRGPWFDWILAESNSPLRAADLTKLARLAANRLNNGLHT